MSVEVLKRLMWIGEDQIDSVTGELDGKLARKAAKLGVPAPTLIRTGDRRVEIRIIEENGSVRWIPSSESRNYLGSQIRLTGASRWAHAVYLEGPTNVCQNGWHLEATLDVMGKEPVIWRAPDSAANIPAEMWKNAHTCQHCGTSRRRKETFILRHDDGTWTRVGRSCLKDFLGHNAAKALGSAVAYLKDLDKIEEGLESGGGANYWHPQVILLVTLVVIEEHGFVPTIRALELGKPATTTIVKDRLADIVAGNRPVPDRPELAHAAGEIAAWAATIDADHGNNFMRNLGAIVRNGEVSWKQIGTLVAAPNVYRRENVSTKPKIDPSNERQHVGPIDSNVTGEVEILRVWETTYNFRGKRLPKTLIVMRPTSGRCHDLVWWCKASGGPASELLQVGNRVKIRGRVKMFEEFRGEPQTVVQRVTVV